MSNTELWQDWKNFESWKLVVWYLMASYCYYCLDKTIMPDADFDGICLRLLKEFDNIEHRHKYLIDKSALEAGTGFHIKEDEYPGIVKGAANLILSSLGKGK